MIELVTVAKIFLDKEQALVLKRLVECDPSDLTIDNWHPLEEGLDLSIATSIDEQLKLSDTVAVTLSKEQCELLINLLATDLDALMYRGSPLLPKGSDAILAEVLYNPLQVAWEDWND